MDYSFRKQCTAAEAIKAVRKHAPKRAIFIHAGVDLYVGPDNAKAFLGSACVELSLRAAIHISLKQAEKFITDALSPVLEGKGARIHVAVCDTCVFIGGAPSP